MVEVNAVGDMFSRCEKYLNFSNVQADIKVEAVQREMEKWPLCDEKIAIYMATAAMFYSQLLDYNGMMLHASAVEFNEKAYLFSGQSGIGKSTHASLWSSVFGDNVNVFNDDKPAIRGLEKWYAYGTPWCGKDGINQNRRVALSGICFLKQGKENRIRRLNNNEAISNLISQTIYKFNRRENLEKMLNVVDQLVREIPIYELTNNATPESAMLSYETMRRGAEEAGL